MGGVCVSRETGRSYRSRLYQVVTLSSQGRYVAGTSSGSLGGAGNCMWRPTSGMWYYLSMATRKFIFIRFRLGSYSRCSATSPSYGVEMRQYREEAMVVCNVVDLHFGLREEKRG